MKKREEENLPMDRISELPEPILQAIFCFLPQKTAVQTSVLSKSWRHLWCRRPIIDFRETYYAKSEKKVKAFLSVLERNLQGTLHLRLDKFTLDMCLDNDHSFSFVKKWIPRITTVNKFHLTLWRFSEYDSALPPLAFDPESIHELYLQKYFFTHQQKGLCFSSLRKLTLGRCELPNEFFPSCSFPCLEVLMLEYCYCATGCEFNLSSCRSVKHLIIENIDPDFKSRIDAPSIVSFRYRGIPPRSVSFAPATPAHVWKSNINFTNNPPLTSSYLEDLTGLLEASSESEISLELAEFVIDRLGITSGGVYYDKPPVAVNQLVISEPWSVMIYTSSPVVFLNTLFRICRPRIMHMNIVCADLQTMAKILLQKERRYFWQHDLEGVVCTKEVYREREIYHASFALQWKGK